jgi:hypothetical protein
MNSKATKLKSQSGFSASTSPGFLATRPLPLKDIPLLDRRVRQMAIISRQHERIAKTIDAFWGQPECINYLQKLIMSGGDGVEKTRVGFKPQVLSALIALTELHEQHIQ